MSPSELENVELNSTSFELNSTFPTSVEFMGSPYCDECFPVPLLTLHNGFTKLIIISNMSYSTKNEIFLLSFFFQIRKKEHDITSDSEVSRVTFY